MAETRTGLSLEVRDLDVTAPSGRTICAVPALSVPPGISLGLRGPSGAGKSTFLFAIAGLLERATGEVAWNGRNVLAQDAEARAAFRRDHLGLIFQDYHLFEEMGGADNAAVTALFRPRPDRAGIRERAVDGLRRLGLDPEGRGVDTLSGGERQRVGVARALAAAPDVLLADEPTANLDRDAADALAADLADFPKDGGTLVIVSHDAAVLDRMDRVVTIRDGRLA